MSDQTNSRRSFIKTCLAAGAAGTLPSFSGSASAQSRPIRVGLVSLFSGRGAQIGITAKNAILLQFDAFNAAGGLGGRKLELVERDSKGQPEEAARLARELIESAGCEILLDGEGSGGAFAVHEVARTSKALCIHAIAETTQLSADPKLKSPNIFRTARQALHDSILGGQFSAKLAKQKGFTRWATIGADYAYPREANPEYMGYVASNGAKVNLVAEAWPKLSQPDYTEFITKILQAKPEALFCSLWGGDLVSFVDQAALFGLLDRVWFFAIHFADYTTLQAIKKFPTAGPNSAIYSDNRYVSAFPATPKNAAWSGSYFKRYNTFPTNWAWEADTAARFLIEAIRKTKGADPTKLAAALRGMEVDSPLGMKDGKIVMRASDQTIIHYALGWGRIIPKQPYMVDIEPANWPAVLKEEAAWKKKKGYA